MHGMAWGLLRPYHFTGYVHGTSTRCHPPFRPNWALTIHSTFREKFRPKSYTPYPEHIRTTHRLRYKFQHRHGRHPTLFGKWQPDNWTNWMLVDPCRTLETRSTCVHPRAAPAW
eukprot:6329986-Amphidinium_carterae.1